MPGFLSWLYGVFGPRKQVGSPRRSRLLNPAAASAKDLATEHDALSRLEEHLFCWLLDCNPADLTTRPENTESILDELERRLHHSRLEELPRQPLTLPMLMRALSDHDITRAGISDVILGDPALTDQLLQVANSPFFRPVDQQIESVDQAVFLLGLDGIRSVIAAAVLRPMLAARSSAEALFAQRVWRWGLTCARAAEVIARAQGQDPNANFMVGLLPALAYIALYREIHRIHRSTQSGDKVPPAIVREALQRFDWTTAQVLAIDWDLPPRYLANLLAAERPVPGQQHTPLNDGIMLGTREVLRHAHQRNMAEAELMQVLSLSDGQFQGIRESVATMLRDSP